MRIHHDPDEWEYVFESRQCTVCRGDTTKCNGGCNGMSGGGLRRRDPADVLRIKAERRRKEEDEILAKAEEIRAIWHRMSVAEQMRIHMVKTNARQKDVAAHMGVSAAYVSDMLRGNRNMTPKFVTAFGEALSLNRLQRHALMVQGAKDAGWRI